MKKMIYWFVSVIVSLTMAFGGYASAGARAVKTVYVNPAGNDSNIGSASLPFKTLSKGVSVLAAGDTMYVSGTFELPLNVSKSGSATAPINIIGSGAVLNMNGAQSMGMNISGSYINIAGFEVTGATTHGVLFSGKHIRFENSSVHNNFAGSSGAGTCGASGSWGSAVKVMVGADDVLVKGNQVYENCGEGIGVTRGLNVVVDGNTVRDNFSVNIYVDNSPYAMVQNNVVTCTGIYLRNGNRPSGIAVAEELYTGWGAQRHDDKIVNNSVAGCYDGISSWVPEMTEGKLINSNISGNTVINGIRRSIAIYSVNQNVVVDNNKLFSAVYVTNSSGVTMTNNQVVGSVPATQTRTPAPATSTAIPVTATKTSIPVTATRTSIPVTATQTAIPATATPTAISASPTATQTSIPVTATATLSLPVTFTSTAVSTVPAGSEVVYDDTNSSFVYSSGWQDILNSQAYNGSYKGTAKAGASISLNFVGQSFSVLYTDGVIYRRMSVYVDGVLVETIYRSTDVTTYQTRWDYPGLLTPGAHTIQLIFANGNGTFDAVITR